MTMLKIIFGGCRGHAQDQDRDARRTAAPGSGDRHQPPSSGEGRAGVALSVMNKRRFPPPWSIEELNDACFVVTDSAGQQVAYVYFEDEASASLSNKTG